MIIKNIKIDMARFSKPDVYLYIKKKLKLERIIEVNNI